jgi:hypothetical protein
MTQYREVPEIYLFNTTTLRTLTVADKSHTPIFAHDSEGHITPEVMAAWYRNLYSRVRIMPDVRLTR